MTSLVGKAAPAVWQVCGDPRELDPHLVDVRMVGGQVSACTAGQELRKQHVVDAVRGDVATRIARDLLDAAAAEGRIESRSAKQQLDHWARLGRLVSLQQSASRRRIDAVLAGTLAMKALRPDERLIVNAELDAAITASDRQIDLADVLARKGIMTVVLDDNGALVQWNPAGSSVFLDLRPLGEPATG